MLTFAEDCYWRSGFSTSGNVLGFSEKHVGDAIFFFSFSVNKMLTYEFCIFVNCEIILLFN